MLPASITAGGVSLNVLLGGPDLPTSTDPGGVEQVAELVPLPETSLALAATLWTVSSDSPTTAPEPTCVDRRHTDRATELGDRRRPGLFS